MVTAIVVDELQQSPYGMKLSLYGQIFTPDFQKIGLKFEEFLLNYQSDGSAFVIDISQADPYSFKPYRLGASLHDFITRIRAGAKKQILELIISQEQYESFEMFQQIDDVKLHVKDKLNTASKTVNANKGFGPTSVPVCILLLSFGSVLLGILSWTNSLTRFVLIYSGMILTVESCLVLYVYCKQNAITLRGKSNG